jgi:hypothetical protein
MRIKFTNLEAIEGQRKDGTVWTGVKVCGTKIEDGSAWKSAGIFDSDDNFKDAVEELRSTDAGTPVNIVHKQKPGTRFWDIIDIQIGDEVAENPQTYAPTTGPSNAPARAGTTGGNDKMTKEEWAAKDRLKAENIARSAALKQANANTEVGADVGTLITMAREMLPFLLGDEGKSDPLDPPKE